MLFTSCEVYAEKAEAEASREAFRFNCVQRRIFLTTCMRKLLVDSDN
jgi:hypothetical protein